MFKYLEYSAFVPGMLWLLSQSMRFSVLRKLPFAFGWLSKRLVAEISERITLPMANSGAIRRDAAKFLRGISARFTLKTCGSFHKFTSPVLIAWSLEDRFFPHEHARRLQADFPHARLEWIEDSYTFSAIEYPRGLAQCINRFL